MKIPAVLALCGPFLVIAAAAQTAPPPPSEATIRTTTSEVLLDIVVRDKHGKLVKNLKPTDVEIYEDGVQQDLKSFRYAGSHETQSQKPAAAPAQAQAPAAPRSLRAVNLVCIVFHNLDPVSRNRASQAVQEFLKGEFAPDTYIGMFRLDDNITPILAFTNKRSELDQAARNIFNLTPMDFARASEAVLTANPTQATINVAISGSGASTSANVTMDVTGGEISKRVITGADVSNARPANQTRGALASERRDFSNLVGMRETDKIIAMIKEMGTLPGRKSILLVSTGLATTGDPDRFQSILSKANDAGVTVYALDIAGLDETRSSQAADIALEQVAGLSRGQTAMGGGVAAAQQRSKQGDTLNDTVRSSDLQSSLRELSEGTGGFLIANTNEFRKPFQRITDDVDAHYEASYRPSSERYDGHLRKIEVKLARPDLVAESRTGYFVLPDLKDSGALRPYETLGLAVLNAKPLPHAFDFRTAMLHFRNDGTTSQGALVFELPGTSLTAGPKSDRGRLLRVSLLALVKDATGQVVDKFSVDTPYEIPDANLQVVRATPILYTHPVSLPPGKYTVEAAVLDREGGRASTGVLDFQTAELRKSISVSSALLVQRIEPVNGQTDAADPLVLKGKRLVPFLGTTLTADAKPYLYFVVYPDKTKTEKPKLQVEFRVGGQVMANQTSDLPAPDASGAIPMVIRAATHAGDCELKITALQGDQSATEDVKYTIGGK